MSLELTCIVKANYLSLTTKAFLDSQLPLISISTVDNTYFL